MITFFTALLLSVPTGQAAPQNVITVTLPIEAHVDGSEMTLGDIAQVDGVVQAEVLEVEGFSLGYAPSPGYSRVIQAWRVEQRLDREFPQLDFVLTGKQACRVWPRTAEITAAELERVARESLAGELATGDMELELHGELKDQTVPAGRVTRSLAARPASGRLDSGTVNIPVDVVVDGSKYRTIWVAFDITVYRELPVLRRAIPLGGKIQPGDLVLRRVALEASFDKQVLTPEMLIGATAKRALASERPVSARDVNRVAAVKAGETVSLEIVNGRVIVHAKVLAMTDGYVGGVVAIRTLSGGKELTAVVTAAGRLKLRLGEAQQN